MRVCMHTTHRVVDLSGMIEDYAGSIIQSRLTENRREKKSVPFVASLEGDVLDAREAEMERTVVDIERETKKERFLRVKFKQSTEFFFT